MKEAGSPGLETAIDGAAGLGPVALSLAVERTGVGTAGPGAGKPPSPTECEERYGRRVLLALLIVFGLSGFCSLAYEVVWTRILTVFTNGTTYAFTIMLSTFLLDIALGSYLVNHLIHRRLDWVLVLASLELGVGLSTPITFAVMSAISWSASRSSLLGFSPPDSALPSPPAVPPAGECRRDSRYLDARAIGAGHEGAMRPAFLSSL